MDDDIFQGELENHDMFWYDFDSAVNQSSFVPYTSMPGSENVAENSGSAPNPTNVNRRMVEFMRSRLEAQPSESQRSFRHAMSERLRREKEREAYLALHSMLPIGTKNDKKSIMTMAAKGIEELKRYKELLERRNFELEEELKATGSGNIVRSSKIRIKVANPISGADSMVEVLKCLDRLGLKTNSIQSKFSDQELLAVLETETEIEAAVVEKAVQRALEDAEGKLLFHFPDN